MMSRSASGGSCRFVAGLFQDGPDSGPMVLAVALPLGLQELGIVINRAVQTAEARLAEELGPIGDHVGDASPVRGLWSELVMRRFDDVDQQVDLVRETPVDSRSGHASAPGDLLDAGVSGASFDQEVKRSGQDGRIHLSITRPLSGGSLNPIAS
jgi:hypothetical protein